MYGRGVFFPLVIDAEGSGVVERIDVSETLSSVNSIKILILYVRMAFFACALYRVR